MDIDARITRLKCIGHRRKKVLHKMKDLLPVQLNFLLLKYEERD